MVGFSQNLSRDDFRFLAEQIIPDPGDAWWAHGSIYPRIVLAAMLEHTTSTQELYDLLDKPIVEIEKLLTGSIADGLIDHRYENSSLLILDVIRKHIQITTSIQH